MTAFAQLSADQIWQVVSYLRSLSATNPAGAAVAGNVERGRQVFEAEAKCVACHQVNGQGTPVGPDLSTAGRLPAEQLQATILDPGAAPSGGRGPAWGTRGGCSSERDHGDHAERRGVSGNPAE